MYLGFHAPLAARVLGKLGLLATIAAAALATPAQATEIWTHAKAGWAFDSSGKESYGALTGTSSTAQASFATEVFGATVSSSARARANLETGELGVSANAVYFGTSSAEARYVEDLAFSIAGADADTITPITVLLNWHGDLSGGGWTDYNFTLLQNGFNASLQFDAASSTGTALYRTQIVGQWTGSAVSGAGTNNQIFALQYNLKGANPLIQLATSMRTTAYLTASVDVYHTARLNLIMPENVSFASTSGTFLSNASAIGSVPEMDSWALMVLGFGAIGCAARRRKATRPSPDRPAAR